MYTSILTVPLSSFDINETKTYKCIVTNTIPMKDTVIPEKIKQVSVAPLLGEAISRIHDDESVALFQTILLEKRNGICYT